MKQFFLLLLLLFSFLLIKKIFHNKSETIVIAPYNPQWPKIFAMEAPTIQKALGDNCLSLHHIGSTAVLGLAAKPKIDIMAVVQNLSSIQASLLEQLGFENRGEVIASGRYFSKKNPPIHLHIFEDQNPLIARNLLFRNWLRTHPHDRQAYELLKKQLALSHHDGMSYCRAKTEFIQKIIEKAENE